MADEQLEKLMTLAVEQREQKFMCENCGWFAASKGETGECRRYPPSVLSSVPLNPLWLWPTVHCEAVCGEFMHRKTGKKFTRDALESVTARVAALEEEIQRCRQ